MSVAGAEHTAPIPMREIQRHLESEISTDIKIAHSQDGAQILRLLSSTIPHDISWRSIRSYMLADSIQIIPDEVVAESESAGAVVPTFSVRLSGYLRGKPLCVHSLGHLPSVGTGRIVSIEAPLAGGPCDVRSSSSVEGVMGEGATSIILHADPEQQDSLTLVAPGAGISGEQTWPDEDEMMSGTGGAAGLADGGMTERMRKLRPENVRKIIKTTFKSAKFSYFTPS